MPITVKGETIGVLDVQSERLDEFEQTDVELMQALASQTGIAIENARLFAETECLLKETEQRGKNYDHQPRPTGTGLKAGRAIHLRSGRGHVPRHLRCTGGDDLHL